MFALEASGTVLLREEAPHLENRWKTSVWSKVSAETKDPRREEIWQEVFQQANGEKMGLEGRRGGKANGGEAERGWD